jgi:hypothetical protein
MWQLQDHPFQYQQHLKKIFNIGPTVSVHQLIIEADKENKLCFILHVKAKILVGKVLLDLSSETKFKI